jgi:hypothetical protein
LGYVALNDALIGSLRYVQQFTVSIVLVLIAAMLATVLLAALRLQFLASDMGHKARYADCIAAVAVGQAAGHLFFQFFGQLFARSALLRRSGMPVEASMSAALYERGMALAVALAFAVPGSLYIFGRITLDLKAGGAELADLAVGVLTAAAAALIAIRPLFRTAGIKVTRGAMLGGLRGMSLTFGIQSVTLLTFVVSAATLAPNIALTDLLAACSVVMFAAALPISFAGWGVRELSAVAALGAVGVPPEAALVSAAAIGVLSLAVIAVLSSTAPLWLPVRRSALAHIEVRSTFNAAESLGWTLPLCTALLVFFQVHVPVANGRLNVSFGDPVALLAGAIFVLSVAKKPVHWRLPGLVWHVVAASAALLLAFVHGVLSFGWTDWAALNKTFGWIVLLSYAAAGALIVRHGGDNGLRMLWRVSLFTVAAIIIVSYLKIIAAAAGFNLALPASSRMVGFAQDPNSFVFQIIIVTVIALSVLSNDKVVTWIIPLLIAGVWLSVSRSGLVTFIVVSVFAIAMRPELLKRLMAGAGIASVVIIIPPVLGADLSLQFTAYRESSDVERWQSIATGWQIFLDHPIFGAGLGYFVAHVPRADGGVFIIHSSPAWLLAELGLVGFGLFLWPALRIFWRELPAMRSDNTALALVLTLVAFGVMSSVQDLLYQRSLWLMMGALLAAPFSQSRGDNGRREMPHPA